MVERPIAKSSVHPQASGSSRKVDLLDGRYRMVRQLGEGGMGAVYLAEHVVLGRQVAIKFLHADYAAKQEMIDRFHREARAAAAVHHRNIIEVFDVGVSPQGDPFLVMEYLEGESLGALLKRAGPLSLGAACAIVEQALLGLQAAHRKGILHRDLKPDNLFLARVPGEPSVVKLIDFGISKFMQSDPNKLRTKTGSLLGTPAYMSPEQARGLPNLDHRSDLFSVGTILYETLTGTLPFAGDTFGELLSNLLTEPPRPPRAMRADFPSEAEPLIVKALAKDPAMRFQTTDEMLEALRDLDGFEQRLERLNVLTSSIEVRGFAAGDLGQTQPPDQFSSAVGRPWWDEAPPPARSRRKLVLAIGGAALFICLAAAGIWGLVHGRKTAPVVPRAEPAQARPTATAPAPTPQAPNEATAEPAQPRKDQIAPKAPEEPVLGEATPDTRRLSSTGKAKPRPARTAAAKATTPIPASVRADTGDGKSLRSGARGTKMSESFE